MTQPIEATVVPEETDRRRQLLLRVLPILFLPLGVGFLSFVLLRILSGEPVPARPPDALPVAAIVALLMLVSALLLLVRIGRPNLSAYVLISVWSIFTAAPALQNGLATNWPALLILPICAAGLLIDGLASISLAGLATLLVLGVGYLETQGIAARPAALTPGNPMSEPMLAAAFWTGNYWSVALLTSMLARGLKRALQQSRAQAAALQQLNAELEQRVAAQTARLLAKEREAAMLEERGRVARDIHDNLAQGLTGIVVQLSASQRASRAAPAEVAEHVDLAQRLAREALAEARRSIWNLRSPALARGDLGDALRGLTTRPAGSAEQLTFAQQGQAYPLAPDVESALLRVAQEALVNVSRHAHARSARVELQYAADTVRLAVRDDGAGFTEEVLSNQRGTPSASSGFGLLGMCERIQAFGGTLRLSNDGGALVVATVPRPREARQ